MSIRDVSDASWEDLMEMMTQNELDGMALPNCTFSGGFCCSMECQTSACGASGC